MKIYHVVIMFIIGMMLSACGGGGGGATPAAVTDTYIGLEVATGADAGVASVVGVGDDAVYTYKYGGTLINVTLPDIEQDGYIQDYTAGGSIARYIGGTSYSYSRFGVVASYNSFGSGDTYTNPEVFYVGQKTSSMPTTGTATYTGGVTTFKDDFFSNAPIEFNVNYGDRTISAPYAEIAGFAFDTGNITGSDFSGTVLSETNDEVGDYHGSFFGPDAEELGGVGTLGDESGYVGFSFGAQRD